MAEEQLTSKEILVRLSREKETLRREFGVGSLALFGSFARDEGHAQSDIDLLVEFQRPIGLFEFARLKLHLEALLGRTVDLVTPDALRRELRETILAEKRHVP